MDQERRKEGRRALAYHGQLSLLVADRPLPVRAVIDISPAGIGVLVDEAVAEGTRIDVVYRDAAIAMNVAGISTWTSPRDGGANSHAVGISLDSPSLLQAFL